MKSLVRIAAIAVFLVAFQGVAASTEPRQSLEPFVLEQYQGGRIDLLEYRGKVVLVNFWATWCPPCVQEFPSLISLKDQLAGEPFEILAINMGEEDEAISGFIDFLDHPVNFPILVDRPTVTIATNWKLQVLPTTIIVDKAGNRYDTVAGERDWNSEESRLRLLALLSE